MRGACVLRVAAAAVSRLSALNGAPAEQEAIVPFLPLCDVDEATKASVLAAMAVENEANCTALAPGEYEPLATAAGGVCDVDRSGGTAAAMVATLQPLLAYAKEDGNAYFAIKDYTSALGCYTEGLAAAQRVFVVDAIADGNAASARPSSAMRRLAQHSAFLPFTQAALALATNSVLCRLRLVEQSRSDSYKHVAKAGRLCAFFRQLVRESKRAAEQKAAPLPAEWLALYGKLLFRTAALHRLRCEDAEARAMYEEVLRDVDPLHAETLEALRSLGNGG